MLQYLIILLDDTSTSYCHYPVTKTERRLMPVDTLRRGIRFAMKENLNIQFVYPDYELPEAYAALVESIDHVKIKPLAQSAEADVVVVEGCAALAAIENDGSRPYVLRTVKEDFLSHYRMVTDALTRMPRISVVITDVERFTDAGFTAYRQALQEMGEAVERIYLDGKTPQLNLLTDRMVLKEMNNCGAGDTSLTLAPDGRFYVCPAFYYDENGYAVGSLDGGPDVKNGQLYRLDHAPLCRICDAYQCRRCVWLNRKTTLEVNTPGHEQCVAAHLERNASRGLLNSLRRHGTFLPGQEEIKEITYLDPFEIRKQW
ncbi:MAG: CXXX repeat peptide maturase [Clostridium sp.]|nr:CXXX repeat peptide maturase [Clostridium sp.]